MFNENSIKFLLLIIICISVLIPPVSFSDTIIDWQHIEMLNYVRAILMFIGCIYLPGANFFNIVLPNSNLHKKFDIEPFFLKLIFYPILSLTLIGGFVCLLEFLILIDSYFIIYVLLFIVTLFFMDLVIQKRFKNTDLTFKRKSIEISKATLIILLLSLGVVIMGFSTMLTLKYLIPGDSYRGISYAHKIGSPGDKSKFYTYSVYWGFISFGLSKLMGIPYINANAFLFLLLYLFPTSTYLLMKVILSELKEIYSLFATVLVVIYSNLFFFFNNNLDAYNISYLIFDCIISFRYKTFAFITFIISLALFIAEAKTTDKFNIKLNMNEIPVIILVAWFSLHSYILYFIPIIPLFIYMISFCLFSRNRIQKFHLFLLFLLFFTIFFIVYDVVFEFYFTWKTSVYTTYFLNIKNFRKDDYLYLNAVIIYLILLSLNIVIYVLLKKYQRIFSVFFFMTRRKNIHFSFKKIFIIFVILFSIFLLFEIYFNILKEILIYYSDRGIILTSEEVKESLVERDQTFLILYLDLIFSQIGLIGIIGLYFSYYCFKRDKKLFKILTLWIFAILFLASSLIFFRWIQYPSSNPIDIPVLQHYYMLNWFSRMWYYSIFPLSILSSIGLIKLRNIVIYKIDKIFNKEIGKFTFIIPSFFIIILTFSNTIISGFYWHNIEYHLSDEDAHIVGWISENIPRRSNILIAKNSFKYIESIALSDYYFINLEIDEAINNYNGNYSLWKSTEYIGKNCDIDVLDYFYGRINVLIIEDYSYYDSASIKIDFDNPQDYGYIEFDLLITDNTKIFYIDIGLGIILISIIFNGIHFHNGTNYVKIMDVENNVWYHLRLYFECTKDNYNGLNKFNWKILINEKSFGDYAFTKNSSYINKILLRSDTGSSNLMFCFDNFIFSWTDDIEVSNLFLSRYKIPIIINHLKSKEIKYYIHNKNKEIWYMKQAEKHIDTEKDLIPNYFKKKLYEYGNYIIYST